MCEDIIRVLGNTTISLRKENEDMQQHILELEKAIELQNENISTLKTKLKHPVRTLFQKIADSTQYKDRHPQLQQTSIVISNSCKNRK